MGSGCCCYKGEEPAGGTVPGKGAPCPVEVQAYLHRPLMRLVFRHQGAFWRGSVSRGGACAAGVFSVQVSAQQPRWSERDSAASARPESIR